jgi:hypothetical protein
LNKKSKEKNKKKNKNKNKKENKKENITLKENIQGSEELDAKQIFFNSIFAKSKIII